MFRIRTLNKIAEEGLCILPEDTYEVSADMAHSDAIMLRSADLHKAKIEDEVIAIVRAGAGVNNIPLNACSERGIVVFNTPGANANAVKELVLAGLFLASRRVTEGIEWAKSLTGSPNIDALMEKEKGNFAGPELAGKTLGIIGLGAIGVLVANDAASLGMEVIGFDPYISVDSAWSLSRSVKHAQTIDEVLAASDYVSIHVPYSEKTAGMLNGEKIKMMKKGARLLNFARGGLAKEADVTSALDSGLLSTYITDFPTNELLTHKKVICMPHIGASTPEAEINCAVMAARQLKDFLENGNIKNSVNFPDCRLAFNGTHRLLVANKNVPNMVGQITTRLASSGVNITDLINHHRGNYAFNIIDTEELISNEIIEDLKCVNGILRVRTIDRN